VNTQIGPHPTVPPWRPAAGVLSLLPTWAPSSLSSPGPQPVTGTFHPYLFAAVHEKDISASYLAATGKVWKVQAGLGIGAKQQLGNVAGTRWLAK